MAIRMKDIADDLGLSIATVSKVFNNHLDIGSATRARVLSRMKELNYQPSLHAQGLASGRTRMVGLVVPDLVHAFFSEVAQSLADVLRKQGYGLLIASSDEEPEVEKEEIGQMIRRRVDVLLVASCQRNPEGLQKIVDVPLVLIDRSLEGFEGSFAGTDDVCVGEMATEHLIGLGRRRIAHIGGQTVSTANDRLTGYRRALARHRVATLEKYIVRRKLGDKSADDTGREAMEKLLRLKPRPDAVFCYNDPAAIGAMDAILAAGLRIPEDVALIGCGNIRYADSLRVPLSSVDIPCKTLGEYAGELALEMAGDQKLLRARKMLVTPKLVLRESTQASRPLSVAVEGKVISAVETQTGAHSLQYAGSHQMRNKAREP
jgi:LacI family transcriptional regulator